MFPTFPLLMLEQLMAEMGTTGPHNHPKSTVFDSVFKLFLKLGFITNLQYIPPFYKVICHRFLYIKVTLAVFLL